jgi:hypothetical protein
MEFSVVRHRILVGRPVLSRLDSAEVAGGLKKVHRYPGR